MMADHHDGLWAAGLAKRSGDGSAEPLCVDCRRESVERRTGAELTLLWRRSSEFRRRQLITRTRTPST